MINEVQSDLGDFESFLIELCKVLEVGYDVEPEDDGKLVVIKDQKKFLDGLESTSTDDLLRTMAVTNIDELTPAAIIAKLKGAVPEWRKQPMTKIKIKHEGGGLDD